jgi:recombination associated protein RdgC
MASKITFPSLKAATVCTVKFKGTRGEPFTKALSFDGAALDGLMTRDPGPTQWSTVGLTSTFGADFPIVSPGATTFAVQVNERMLPAKVRDEAVQKLAASITEREGRKVTKKEYRELRDEVEVELLPKAFIRRSVTLVTFCANGRMIVWTSSARRFDLCVAHVQAAAEAVRAPLEHCSSVFPDTVNLSSALLLPVAKGDVHGLDCGDSGVMVKPDDDVEPVLRLKNVALNEVSGAVARGYIPKALSIKFGDETSFTLSGSGVFTKFEVDGFASGDGDKEDRIGAFTACLFGLQRTLNTLVTELLHQLPDDGDL